MKAFNEIEKKYYKAECKLLGRIYKQKSAQTGNNDQGPGATQPGASPYLPSHISVPLSRELIYVYKRNFCLRS